MITNTYFALNDSFFQNITTLLFLFESSFGNFSSSNVDIINCLSINDYLVFSFNSILFFENMSSINFSTGFFQIQNSTLILKDSIFNNTGNILSKSSKNSIFYLEDSFSYNKIQIENSIFLDISTTGNGSV